MSRTTSDLPFGSEFSPSQIELPAVLELVKTNEGNASALEAAILERYFSSHAEGREDAAGSYNRAGSRLYGCSVISFYSSAQNANNYRPSEKSSRNSRDPAGMT